MLVVKDHFGRFTWNFFELGVKKECLEVFLDEFLHLRKLIQTSSGA
jgi:hypothetical protein